MIDHNNGYVTLYELSRRPHPLIYNECRGRRKYWGGRHRKHWKHGQRGSVFDYAAIPDCVYVAAHSIKEEMYE